MKYKGYTIVTDMDGTLLNSKGKLSEENINSIRKFISKGGNFTVATGRMLPSVERFLNKIEINLPAILYNGTKIYDFNNKEIIFEEFLEDERKYIVKEIARNNPSFGIEIYSDETVYIFQECKYTSRFSKLGYDVIYNVDESIFEKRWTKVLIIGEEEEVDLLENRYKEDYEDGEVIRSGEKYFELVPGNTSKGQALEYLCKKLKIDKNKLITIGDNMNDLDLINVGHLGFCVENGSKRLKDKAMHIAPSNDNHVIEFLLSKIVI